jgi:hypothetical protein
MGVTWTTPTKAAYAAPKAATDAALRGGFYAKSQVEGLPCDWDAAARAKKCARCAGDHGSEALSLLLA